MAAKQKDIDLFETMTVQEAAEKLSISKSFAYRLIKDGEMPSVRLGRKVRVPKAEFERWYRDRILRGRAV